MTRFEIQDIVRQDQNGVTFCALDKKTNEIVSLRRFFPFGQDNEDEEGGVGLDKQEGKAFSSACQKLSKVEHPALRRTIFGDTDPIDGMPYLVTQWVEGESLSDVLGNNTMDPKMIIGLVRQALDVCLILSKSLNNEAVWVDTKLESIIVSNATETPKFNFRICPFKWLGTQSHVKDLTGIVSLVEALMGWKSKLVSDQAGLGLGGWLKLLRQNPEMKLSDAIQSLPDPASNITPEPTTTASYQPVQQPFILKSPKPTFFSGKNVFIMAISACLTGALIFFIYKQNTKETAPAIIPFEEDNTIVEQQPETIETSPKIETTIPKTETTSPKINMWSPAEITTAAWYDASDTATITASNGLVSQWNDISGNDKHATQSTNNLKPKTGTRTINQLNAIDFDVDNLGREELNMNGKAIFAVVLPDDGGDGGQIFSHKTSNNQLRMHQRGQISYAASPPRYEKYRSCNHSLTMNKPGIAGFMLSNTLQYSVNGMFDDTGTTENTSVGAAFNQFGARIESSEALDGLLGEIIITDSIPDTDARQKIEGYLAHKWGLLENLPAAHPYRSSAPVSSGLKNAIIKKPLITEKDPTETKETKTIDPKLASWSPVDIQATAWFDASKATIKDGTVTIVNAGSDGGTISGPASLAANGIGNLQAVQLNGTNQYLTGDYTNSAETLTVFFVGKSLNTIQQPYAGIMSIWQNSQLFDWNNASSSVLFSQNNTLANSIYTHRNTAILSSATGTLTNGFLAISSFNGSSHTLYLNGTPSTGVASTGSFSANKVIIGGRWQRNAIAPPYWNGNFGETIICNADLTTADRQKIEGYLAHKWGLLGNLPADHPYKLSAPDPSESAVKDPPLKETTSKETEIERPKTGLWSPAEISPAAWYDADDLSTITANAGAVSQWNAKSGNGRNAAQGTGTLQPITGSAKINGLNVLTLDEDYLLANVAAGTFPSGIQVTAVFQKTGASIASESISGRTLAHIPAAYDRHGPTSFVGNGSGFKSQSGLTSISSMTSVTLLSYGADTTTFFEYLNGSTVKNVAHGTTYGDTATTIGIGSRADGGTRFRGTLAELVFTGALSTTDRQKLEGYLAHKWGLAAELPANHPYKLSAPGSSSTKPETPVSLPKKETTSQELPTISSKIRLWSPEEITTTAWYDAADASTLTVSSGAVGQWRDKSGNGLHLAQSLSARQPSAAAKINNLNALDFTDDVMTMSKNPFGATVNNAFVIAVYKVDSIQDGTLFSLTGSENHSSRWNAQAPHGDKFMYFDCGGVIPGSTRVSVKDYEVIPGNAVLASFYSSTTDNLQQVHKNGSLLNGDSSGHAVATVGNISVGGVTTSFQDATIGEFIIINGTVDDATRQKLEGYLANKWGTTASLPADHPYKLSAPIPSILASKDTETIKTLKVGDPINLQGIVRSAKFSSTGKSIYLSFSDPVVETDIRVVIHGNEYDGTAFTEEEFAKLIGKNLVFNGTVYKEEFNDRPPFVKITERNQIKLATKTPDKPNDPEKAVNRPVFKPDESQAIAKLDLKEPVAVKGIVKSVNINTIGGGLYFAFSEPWDGKQIRVVTYEKGFENGVHDSAAFKKIEAELQNLVGKTVTFNGTVHRQKNNNTSQFVFISKREDIVVEAATDKATSDAQNKNDKPDIADPAKNTKTNTRLKLQGTLRAVKLNTTDTAIVIQFIDPHQPGRIRAVAYKANYKDPFDIKKFEPFVGKKVSIDGPLIIDANNDKFVEITDLKQITLIEP